MTRPPGVEYSTIREIRGPIIIVDNVSGVAYDELVEIETSEGELRLGKVIEVGEDKAIVQVFEGTQGLSISGTRARFLGKTMELGVSEDMLGRVFDGLGRPIDGLPEPVAEEYRDVNGEPINPNERVYPSDFIQTGISAIDGMNSLVRGQKLPIFSGAGLPHNQLAAQIARQATVPGKGEEFAVIFAAIGVQNDEARFFRQSLEESGAITRSALFLNLADHPAIERITTPRIALTLAEYLAFEKDYHVLAILTDMTNYCFSGENEVITQEGDVVQIRDYIASLLADGGRGYSKALSWHNWEIRPGSAAIVEIVKPREKKMIYLRTRSGAELTITPDHKLLVDTDEGPKMMEASKIRVGDLIYSVKKLEISSTWRPSLLELLWISEDEDVYVYFRHPLIEEALKKFGSLRKAADSLRVDYARMMDSWRRRCYKIGEVVGISARFGISLRSLSKLVERVTCGKKASLKFGWGEANRELLKLAGIIASDGVVGLYPEKNIYYIALYSSSRELIKKYREIIWRLFPGIKVEEWESPNGVKHLRVNNKPLALLFKALGLTSDLKPLVKLPEDLIREFLAGYFDGNGHIGRSKAAFTTASKLKAKRLQLLLKRLGIPSIISERRTGSERSIVYDVTVYGRGYIGELFRGVELYHPYKKKALRKLSKRDSRGTDFDRTPAMLSHMLREIRKKYGLRQSDIGPSSTISNAESGARRLTREKALEIAARLRELLGNVEEVKVFSSLVSGNYVLDKVIEVKEKSLQDEYVYDLTIPLSHTIIVENGVISSNCESLREISAAREEVPGRKGYPGYMYTDLASIYERAGRVRGGRGSLTQMPIVSMPSDDITHPIPDLTGYITEGQIVLSRDLYRKGIYPPINVLMSLSRLMGPGIIAEKKTREDHGEVSNQLYASYTRAAQLRALSEIIGKSGLSDIDLKYLEFGDLFEQKFLKQGYNENRSLDQTLDLAWEILSTLPEEELTKISEENLKKYYRGGASR